MQRATLLFGKRSHHLDGVPYSAVKLQCFHRWHYSEEKNTFIQYPPSHCWTLDKERIIWQGMDREYRLEKQRAAKDEILPRYSLPETEVLKWTQKNGSLCHSYGLLMITRCCRSLHFLELMWRKIWQGKVSMIMNSIDRHCVECSFENRIAFPKQNSLESSASSVH